MRGRLEIEIKHVTDGRSDMTAVLRILDERGSVLKEYGPVFFATEGTLTLDQIELTLSPVGPDQVKADVVVTDQTEVRG